MRAVAIINARSGTALVADREAITGALRSAFSAAGHDLECRFVDPGALAAAFAEAAASDVEAVLAGGGDGTARTAARALMGTGKTLGVVPLGTMNRLARSLGVPLGIGEAATALASARVMAIDVASVNGSLFLSNSLMGLPTEFAARRQELRGRPALDRLYGYAGVVAAILRSRKRFWITIDHGAELKPVRALSIAVSSNAYAETPSLFLRKVRLDGGELSVYISRHRSGWALARAALRAMLGRHKADPGLLVLTGHEITMRSHRRHIRLSNDGEVEVHATPLEYRIHPRALNVLAPEDAS